ncbi:hypothetical protein [Flexithrix dorotheae]|uniref:hypothetical protein n=1 Tax=Flexithrix dorotheae TaxID=70993 RepID=UPI00036F6A88|nr:hypothetical protein [Flexithrix dorotheae]
MKQLFIIPLILVVQFGIAQDCKKCNIDALKKLSRNFEDLNHEIVKQFVCTFDSSCNTNIEFSQWSNELIFTLIEEDISLLNGALHELGYNYVLLIANEIESPVIEVDYLKIYSIIKNALGPKDIILAEKEAIKKAAAKAGIQLK